MINNIKVGKFIQEERKRVSLSQEELADMLYITRSAVSKWERGKTLPDYDSMLKLCELFDVTVDEFLAGSRIDEENEKETNDIEMSTIKEEKLKGVKLIISFLLSIFIAIFAFYNSTYISDYIPLSEIMYYLFPILAVINNTYFIYKILRKSKKLKENKDKKHILILKQLLNGITFSFFIFIVFGYMWPMGGFRYEYNEYVKTLYIIDFAERGFIALIIAAVCLLEVFINKNLEEYLKLITYSELIIIPLLIIWECIYNFLIYSSSVKDIWYTFDLTFEYILRILNISLPLAFYLKFINKDEGRMRK